MRTADPDASSEGSILSVPAFGASLGKSWAFINVSGCSIEVRYTLFVLDEEGPALPHVGEAAVMGPYQGLMVR